VIAYKTVTKEAGCILYIQSGHNVLLPHVEIVTLLCVMLADDIDGCYKLLPIQLQYSDIIIHFTLYNMTQALIVQWIRLCPIILMADNNSTPCSVG
jgi:hypothetical protein